MLTGGWREGVARGGRTSACVGPRGACLMDRAVESRAVGMYLMALPTAVALQLYWK